MSESASVDAGGGAAASGASDHFDRLRSAFETYNELVRTEGDVLAWGQEYFDPQAEYRPIEDRDWFGDIQGAIAEDRWHRAREKRSWNLLPIAQPTELAALPALTRGGNRAPETAPLPSPWRCASQQPLGQDARR